MMVLIRNYLHMTLCISFIGQIAVECSGFNNPLTFSSRHQDNSKCGKSNFTCRSGQCIDKYDQCDGKVDCVDGSDENYSCKKLRCPPYLFKCKYGACIEERHVCDGIAHCRDGSDEDTKYCKEVHAHECREDEFKCRSGQCISQYDVCDGKPHCNDYSDETKNTCWNMKCPGFTYKCKYGACVNGDVKCNGVEDCYDGSDEDPAICRTNVTIIPTTTPHLARRGECILPPHPDFGQWQLTIPGSYSPGTPVRSGVALKMLCKKQYMLDGDNIILCENGAWSSSVARCLKICPPIESTPLMKVTCTYKDKEHENCTSAINGTLARFQCAPFNEDAKMKMSPIHVCKDGTWDQPRPFCTPDLTPIVIKLYLNINLILSQNTTDSDRIIFP